MKNIASFILSLAVLGLAASPASAMFEPVHVPDMASTAALLGAGLVGLFGLRRVMNRR